MIKLLIPALLIISFNLFAEINISYGQKGELILRDKSCNVLKAQSAAICSLKEQVDSVRTVEANNCISKGSGQFELKVLQCLPDFIKSTQNKVNYQSGPNCWGTALYMKGISRKPRFVWSTEMAYWLDTPVCRKLLPGERVLPGDILNIYGPEYKFNEEGEGSKDRQFWEALYPGRMSPSSIAQGYTGFHKLLHSETYVSDLISFGKDSPSKLDKFKFNPLLNVYGRPRDPECQENQNLSPHLREYANKPQNVRNSKCSYFSNAFRCGNFSAYLGNTKLDEVQTAIRNDIESLYHYQSQLFDMIMIKGRTINERDLSAMLSKADDMATESLNELRLKPSDKKLEMLLVQKFFTAAGIRKSLELAELIPATEPL